MDDGLLERDVAEVYAGWFRALAGPARFSTEPREAALTLRHPCTLVHG
ncbi:MAG: hypothetical protein ACYDH5_13855 [Acidimicrobiales bacterium]